MIAVRPVWEKCKSGTRSAAGMAKAKALWAWRHRTKTAGGLTTALGGFKVWALDHPTIHLPGEGYLLMACGASVIAIGAYNTMADWFGWKDDP